jgi:glycosyltransferase involved in cell wall biosynthesis
MMGPSLSQQGGMATVENLIMDRTADDIQICHVTTHEEGTVFHRIRIFCLALVMLLLSLLKNRCDLVHLHVSERGSVVRVSILTLIARFFRRPVIIHAHGCEFHTFYNSLTVFFQKCISLVFRQCVCVFVLSKSWRDYYVSQCGLSPERTVVLTNPVDFPTTVPDRSGLDKITLLFLGRVGQRKGAFDLLRAFSGLSKENKEKSTLIIAGDGELNNAYELAESLEIQPFVSIPGWLSREKCKELLAQADIFILPSYNEALPMSILEAMSWGLPIISTPVGGIPEIISPYQNRNFGTSW